LQWLEKKVYTFGTRLVMASKPLEKALVTVCLRSVKAVPNLPVKVSSLAEACGWLRAAAGVKKTFFSSQKEDLSKLDRLSHPSLIFVDEA
jgi:hypothetical protein